MLDSKYDWKDQVLSELYVALDQLSPASDTVDSMKTVYYQLEGQLTALKPHGESVDTNTLLRDKVYAKYPVKVVCCVTSEELLMPTEFQAAITKYLSLRASIKGVCRLPTPEEKPNKSLTAALAPSASPKVDPSPLRETRKGDSSPSRKSNRKNRE